MQIAGLEKNTLLDYPGKVAAIVFTYGCNFRCPFCHNPELVTEDEILKYIIPEDEIFLFLNKRKGLLDALVITGGEPLLQMDLVEFIKKVKNLGFLVKLDTNGLLADKVEEIVKLGIVDYWAMDIKNSEERYLETIGLTQGGNDEVLNNIKRSIKSIMNSGVDYEFRTTFVPGLHDEESARGIGELVNGAKRFYIQNFRKGKTIDSEYSKKVGFSDKELKDFQKILLEYIPEISIRNS